MGCSYAHGWDSICPDCSPPPPDSAPLMAELVDGIRQDCDMGVWDNAFLAAEAEMNDPFDGEECFARGADWGAKWLAAIILMFEAIRERERHRRLERLVGHLPTDEEEAELASDVVLDGSILNALIDDDTAE